MLADRKPVPTKYQLVKLGFLILWVHTSASHYLRSFLRNFRFASSAICCSLHHSRIHQTGCANLLKSELPLLYNLQHPRMLSSPTGTSKSPIPLILLIMSCPKRSPGTNTARACLSLPTLAASLRHIKVYEWRSMWQCAVYVSLLERVLRFLGAKCVINRQTLKNWFSLQRNANFCKLGFIAKKCYRADHFSFRPHGRILSDVTTSTMQNAKMAFRSGKTTILKFCGCQWCKISVKNHVFSRKMRVASKTLAGAVNLKLVENGKGCESAVFSRW